MALFKILRITALAALLTALVACSKESEILGPDAEPGLEHKEELRLQEWGRLDWFNLKGDVALSGDRAYCATRGNLYMLDISDPANPAYAAHRSVPGWESYEMNIIVDGGFAFLWNIRGFRIVDLRSPDLPVIGAYDESTQKVRDLVRHENYVYLLLDNQIRIIWISNPSSPTLSKTITPSQKYIRHFGVGEDYFCLTYCWGTGDGYDPAPYYSRIEVYDISRAVSPQKTGSLEMQGAFLFGNPIAIEGGLVYLKDYFWLTIVNVSDPGAPVFAGKLLSHTLVTDGEKTGDYIYHAHEEKLDIVDVSTPTDPVLAGQLELPAALQSIASDGEYLVASTEYGRIEVFQGTGTASLTPAGGFAGLPGLKFVTGHDGGLHINGSTACIATGMNGVNIVDYTNGFSSFELQIVHISAMAFDAAIAGDRICIGSGQEGYAVYDIVDPLQPVRLTHGDNTAFEVAARDNIMAIVNNGVLLSFIDISSPDAPIVCAEFRIEATEITGMIFVQNYLYLCGSTVNPKGSLVAVVDASDVYNPVAVGKTTWPNTDSPPRKITYSNGYLYVAHTHELTILDVQDAENPCVVRNIPIVAYDISVAGDYAYIASGVSGIQVVNISNPTAPYLAGLGDPPGGAIMIAVDGNNLIAANNTGFFAYRINSL